MRELTENERNTLLRGERLMFRTPDNWDDEKQDMDWDELCQSIGVNIHFDKDDPLAGKEIVVVDRHYYSPAEDYILIGREL